MHYTLNAVDRHHQVNLTESAPVTLLPKCCVCGKPAFAKRLVQYGACVACQLGARVTSLEPEDLVNPKFMLGVKQAPRSTWGNRNVFLARSSDLPSMTRLVTAGFVRAGGTVLQIRYFRAMATGYRLAGLNTTALRRALGDRP